MRIADAKPHQKSEAPSEKCREPEAAKPEEKPAQVAQPELQKDDNPFPRYLDMFKNNPEALTATFLALWWEISLMKVHGKLRYSPMKVYAHAIYSLMKVQ